MHNVAIATGMLCNTFNNLTTPPKYQLIEDATSWSGAVKELSRLDLGDDQADWSAYSARSYPFKPGVQKFPWKHVEATAESLGYGCHPNGEIAMLYAIVECFERMCAARWSEGDVIETTAAELGSTAINLHILPVCSESEYRNPYCTLRRPNRAGIIRWVRGQQLDTEAHVYIPLVLSHTHTDRKYQDEAFAHPITTGCAAHSDAESAILSAIHEVIERDALALTWLLCRDVPEVKLWHLDEVSIALVQHHRRLYPYVETRIFNITTDIGVPVLLCLQTQVARPYAYNLISCAAGTTYLEALHKVLREAAMRRFANARPKDYPHQVNMLNDAPSGAAYMASVTRNSAFDFLRKQRRLVYWRKLQDDGNRHSWTLRNIIVRLNEMAMPAYCIDLSTQELRVYGIKACRVIVPGLQPISFHYSARFLGHTRLQQFARKRGCDGDACRFNQYPLPFA